MQPRCGSSRASYHPGALDGAVVPAAEEVGEEGAGDELPKALGQAEHHTKHSTCATPCQDGDFGKSF